MRTRSWRYAAAVTAAACAVTVGSAEAAAADTGRARDVPAVDILPVATSSHDPNQGTWFVYRLKRGATVHGLAQLINPANVAQHVMLFPRELDFAESGT